MTEIESLVLGFARIINHIKQGFAIIKLKSNVNDHNSNLILFGFRITKRILKVNKRVVLKSCFDGGMKTRVIRVLSQWFGHRQAFSPFWVSVYAFIKY